MFIRFANLDSPDDQHAIVELIDHYARDIMGGGTSLSDDVKGRLIVGLKSQSQARVWLAHVDDLAVGVAICFLGYSTFRAQPLINVHDLAVHVDYRGRGVGRSLLAAVEQEARRSGCCRITLEVRADNRRAQGLYRHLGFAAGSSTEDAMEFWTKHLS